MKHSARTVHLAASQAPVMTVQTTLATAVVMIAEAMVEAMAVAAMKCGAGGSSVKAAASHPPLPHRTTADSADCAGQRKLRPARLEVHRHKQLRLPHDATRAALAAARWQHAQPAYRHSSAVQRGGRRRRWKDTKTTRRHLRNLHRRGWPSRTAPVGSQVPVHDGAADVQPSVWDYCSPPQQAAQRSKPRTRPTQEERRRGRQAVHRCGQRETASTAAPFHASDLDPYDQVQDY